MPTSPAFLILHVSDVHFGAEMYPGLTSIGPLKTGKILPRPGRIKSLAVPKGFFPHDVGACEDLENSIKKLIREVRPKKVLLVISGDLTATGADSEFVMALTYLRSRLVRFWTSGMGLGRHTFKTFAVPGNHDHWSGRRISTIVNRPSKIHGTYFVGPAGQTWWHKVLRVDNIQLQLMGLDSSSKARPHIAARGYVDQTHLDSLKKKIAQADSMAKQDGTIPARVLVVHHPVMGQIDPLHAFKDESRKRLVGFLYHEDIHFFLTGHLHRPSLPSILPRSHLEKFPIELRCGTSTQGAPLGKVPSKSGNVYLAHMITAVSSGAEWHTRIYQRDKHGPFIEERTLSYNALL